MELLTGILITPFVEMFGLPDLFSSSLGRFCQRNSA